MGLPKTDRSWWRDLTKRGPLEKGMANHFSILAISLSMNSMKRQKDRTLKDELPRLVGAQYATAAAAAAKSLQLCPTLCDPIDGSPPGCPVPGILQARRLEWIAISFSSA